MCTIVHGRLAPRHLHHAPQRQCLLVQCFPDILPPRIPCLPELDKRDVLSRGGGRDEGRYREIHGAVREESQEEGRPQTG